MSTADTPGEPPQLGTVGTILGDLSRFPMLVDRVQQGILDFMYLGRLIAHPEGLVTEGTRTAGRGRQRALYYDGNSQGGIIGGALVALEVDGDHASIGVPGMNYSTLLQRSTDFGRPAPTTSVTEQLVRQPVSVLGGDFLRLPASTRPTRTSSSAS